MLAGLAGLLAVLILVLAVAQLVGDDGDEAVVADDATTTTAGEGPAASTDATGTTAASAASTAAPTTTGATRPPATTTTTRFRTTTTVDPGPVVTGAGAILLPPGSTERREMRRQAGCESMAAPGWEAECGTFTVKGGVELAWLVEVDDDARRAFVFRKEQGRQWLAVLIALDEGGTRFEDVNVRVGDVSGDGSPEAVFGFHRRGTGDFLAVDVVEGPDSVVVHRELRDGRARASSGQLDAWERCCPTEFDHHTIRYVDGVWRIAATVRERQSAVPPSHV